MPTATQIADLRNALGKLFPSGKYSNDHVDNVVNILAGVSEEKVAQITVDQTFNNDSTLANLAGLVSESLPINTTHVLDLTLLIDSASATPGAKLLFVIPAGATLSWELGSPADLGNVINTIATEGALSTVIGTGMVTAKGILTIGATAGTIQVQGAQGTPTVEDTKYLVGSNMIVTRIA